MWIPAREVAEKCRGHEGNEDKTTIIDEGITQTGRHYSALQHLVKTTYLLTPRNAAVQLTRFTILIMIIIIITITKNYIAPLNFKIQRRFPDHRLLAKMVNGPANTGTDTLVVFFHATETKVNTFEHVRRTVVESRFKMTPEVGRRPGVKQFGVDLLDVQ